MSRRRLFESQAPTHPDPIRIAALSAAIAANIALLALLVRPPEFTLPTVHTDDRLISIIVPDKKPIEPPKPPPVVKVVKHEVPNPVIHPIPVKPLPVPPVVNDQSTAMST
jgi:protein TonB